MKTVQRGNRQLQVADDRLEDMRKLGYVEVDKRTGKPVDVPAGKDNALEPLQAENKRLKKENADLKKENAGLKEQVEALTAQAKRQTGQD